MDVGKVVAISRLRAGWTQIELARAVGTSQPTLSAYEQGRVVPTIETLERLLAACGRQLTIEERSRRSTRENRKSHTLHVALVGRIAAHPRTALAKGRENLKVMRAADSEGHSSRAITRWGELLDGPIDDVVRVLIDPAPGDEDLAASNPFAGLLTPKQRWDVLRRFRLEEDVRRAS